MGTVTLAEQIAPGTPASGTDVLYFKADGLLHWKSPDGTEHTPAVMPAAGADGTVLMARAGAATGLVYVAALKKAIYGFTYANDGGDAVNDLSIAGGGAMDATGAYWMTGSAKIKQSDAAWAVGTVAGALDTGVVGNNDYYIWVIARSDTGVVDYLFSLSSTAPTMPASYDFKRLIGWFKRVGGAIVAFTAYEIDGGGIEFKWNAPTLDVNLANTLTTTRRTDAVKVPLNFSVISILEAHVYDAASAAYVNVCCPDETDVAVSITRSNLQTVTTKEGRAQMFVRTSAAGLIAARADIATVDAYKITTIGFNWARRN